MAVLLCISGLTAAEKQDLIAFLKTLTGQPTPTELPVLRR
jgi:hypothetical protein